MSPQTRFLARLIGLYSIIVPLAMVAHRQATIETVRALLSNPPMQFLFGLLAVATGLAIVVGHNLWTGGTVPVAITLIGWGTLFKGMLFLFLSPESETALFMGNFHYEQYFYGYSAVSILIGAWLFAMATVNRKHTT